MSVLIKGNGHADIDDNGQRRLVGMLEFTRTRFAGHCLVKSRTRAKTTDEDDVPLTGHAVHAHGVLVPTVLLV